MVVPSNLFREAGIRKAAILVASLDQAAADALLDCLSPEQSAQVRQAVMTLDEIGPEELDQVIGEFRRIGPLIPGESPAGIELDGLTPPKIACENASIGETSQSSDSLDFDAEKSLDGFDEVGESDAEPFGFLHCAEDEDLARLLGSERPQTAALVLSRLPSDRAGRILECFAPAMQVEVVRRLTDLENADPEVLREVEKSLETRLSRYFAAKNERSAGPEAVAEILGACDPKSRRRILDNIASSDTPLAERFGRRPIRFEDLARLDDATLAAILQAAEPEVVQAAMLGTPPALFKRFLRCVDPEESRRLRRCLSHPDPIRLSDVEDSMRQLAALAERMSCIIPERSAIAA
jgi:flagellar motor switch protein FliG